MSSTMCGIVMADGRDCQEAVSPDAPLNLCASHLTAAAAWALRNDQSTRERIVCEVCGQREGRAGITGYACARCQYQSPDFTGSTYLTPAERDQSFQRSRDPRAVDVVYYIQFGDRIKIGTSSDVRRRLNALPHDRVLAFERGGRSMEASRHSQFRAHRIARTEWFDAAQPLLEHIASIATDDPWEMYRKWRA